MARNAADRLCRAVLFDLDDTLIATSRIDRAAILKAARGRSDVAAKFAALLKAQPTLQGKQPKSGQKRKK